MPLGDHHDHYCAVCGAELDPTLGCPECAKHTPNTPMDAPVPIPRINSRLWVWSDTHFGHKNIEKFGQRPRTHESTMLSNWIALVGENDHILHLGDLFIGGSNRWANVLSRMPGKKFIVLGNHDPKIPALYAKAGFTVLPPFVWKGVAFSHRPVTADFPLYDELQGKGTLGNTSWETSVHGHVHKDEWHTEHDGLALPGKRYVNVNVDQIGLAPRQLGKFLGKL